MLDFIPSHNTAIASKIFFLSRIGSLIASIVSVGLTAHFISFFTNSTCPGWLIGALVLAIVITLYGIGTLIFLWEKIQAKTFAIFLIGDLALLACSILIEVFVGGPLGNVQCDHVDDISAAANAHTSSQLVNALSDSVGNSIANFANTSKTLCQQTTAVYAMWIVLTAMLSFSIVALGVLIGKNRGGSGGSGSGKGDA